MAVTSADDPSALAAVRSFGFSAGEPGPRVLVVAATSPVDYAAIDACWDLAETLRSRPPERGSVLVVPVIDEPSFLARSILPYLPGGEDGAGQVERTGTVRAALRALLAEADLVIDVRGGGLHAIDAHWVAGSTPAGASDRALDVAAILERVPADLWLDTDAAGPARPIGPVALASETMTPWVIVSSGGIARDVASGSARLLSSLLALLGCLGIVSGVTEAARPAFRVGPMSWRHEVVGPGLWTPTVEAGERVETGTILGWVTDPFGDSRTSVESPLAGWVLRVTTSLGVGGGRVTSATGTFADTVTIVGDRT